MIGRLNALAHSEHVLGARVFDSSKHDVTDELGADETEVAAEKEGVSLFQRKQTFINLKIEQ